MISSESEKSGSENNFLQRGRVIATEDFQKQIEVKVGRRLYVGWLRSAKKQETMERRIEEAIKLLTENKKLGMK